MIVSFARLRRFLIIGVLLTLALPLSSTPGRTNGCGRMLPIPEQIPAIMIGDRLIDIALELGVAPQAMSIRGDLWTRGRTLAATKILNLGCPKGIVSKFPNIVPDTMRKNGTKLVLVEHSKIFDRTKPQREPMKILPLLKKADIANELGAKVEIIDFTQGLEKAIRAMGKALNRTEEAEKLIAKRTARLNKAKSLLPLAQTGLKVVVLDGTLQKESGKAFARVHLSGGYTDDFLLDPMGAVNVGNVLAPKGDKSGYAMLGHLNNLDKAAPDIIVMTGDADAVQRKLVKAIAKKPDLLKTVPALSHGAVFALPAYYDSEVVGYPLILSRWINAFSEVAGK